MRYDSPALARNKCLNQLRRRMPFVILLYSSGREEDQCAGDKPRSIRVRTLILHPDNTSARYLFYPLRFSLFLSPHRFPTYGKYLRVEDYGLTSEGDRKKERERSCETPRRRGGSLFLTVEKIYIDLFRGIISQVLTMRVYTVVPFASSFLFPLHCARVPSVLEF